MDAKTVTAEMLFDKCIGAKDVANFLGVSLRQVNYLMKEGLPFYKIGRSVRFRLSEVQVWLSGRSYP